VADPVSAAEDEARLAATVAAIEPLDPVVLAAAEAELAAKTKPRGSLGRLEELAARIAAIRGAVRPEALEAAVVVAAADHGVAAEGVSAYPPEVTAQMVANFAGGGAAVSVLARRAGARLLVIDAGVGRGTANLARGAAMSEAEALGALGDGIELAAELARDGVGAVVLGEMGIGNTTAASALSAALLDLDPSEVTGPGTGLDAAAVARKAAVVRRALAVNRARLERPLAVLAALGGLEIATLSGLALGGAARRMVVVVDGFISAVAALVTVRLAPAAAARMVAAHISPEPGHRLVLAELGLEPLLDFGLRLGEGSGGALALPLIDAAQAILAEMATFGEAGVTDAGR
jgi:nicotinate-nucleotide--dimethylbenzimidazole phosphoribosyltransferase